MVTGRVLSVGVTVTQGAGYRTRIHQNPFLRDAGVHPVGKPTETVDMLEPDTTFPKGFMHRLDLLDHADVWIWNFVFIRALCTASRLDLSEPAMQVDSHKDARWRIGMPPERNISYRKSRKDCR